jgi:hypothetical protein
MWRTSAKFYGKLQKLPRFLPNKSKNITVPMVQNKLLLNSKCFYPMCKMSKFSFFHQRKFSTSSLVTNNKTNFLQKIKSIIIGRFNKYNNMVMNLPYYPKQLVMLLERVTIVMGTIVILNKLVTYIKV